MSRLGDKKGVYHSGMVVATERGGAIPLVLKGDVQSSVNKTLLGTVYFRIVGEDKDHYYNIENATIKAQLEAAPRDTVLLVSAFGEDSKENKASQRLEIVVQQGGAPVAGAAATGVPSQAGAAAHSIEGRETQPPQTHTDHRPKTIMKHAADCYVAAAEIMSGLIAATPRGELTPLFPFIREASPDMKLDVVARLAHSMMMAQDHQAGARPLRAKAGRFQYVEDEEKKPE